MTTTVIKLKDFILKHIYLAIGILTTICYGFSVNLLAVQSPWVNVTMGKASVSTVTLLIMWVILTERMGKKRHWGGRRIMLLNAIGIGVLMLTIKFTPI